MKLGQKLQARVGSSGTDYIMLSVASVEVDLAPAYGLDDQRVTEQ